MNFINVIKTFLGSKKWYMTIVGSAIVMALNHFGFPEFVQATVGGLFGTYIIGQGISDASKPKV